MAIAARSARSRGKLSNPGKLDAAFCAQHRNAVPSAFSAVFPENGTRNTENSLRAAHRPLFPLLPRDAFLAVLAGAISGSVATMLHGGRVSITAPQPGTKNFASASVSRSLKIR